ncbi:sugar phosphate isomerase/epimerase family protein [Nonomuraea sp. JJY05]|jgi:sugar phosphate isomerase/epimerase|uniref:sugar phosphate isomerase/epimerase family protein n=1 Tax=Nonomuraea sp. JJY05 TaxID=3350255 RepID=UPI00373E24E7
MNPELTASFVTLSGAGFAQPARVPFAERCRAAAAAGFTGIGLHAQDYQATLAQGHDDASLRAVLHEHGLALRETEFLTGWAMADIDITVFEDLAGAFSPHHVTAGELGGGDLDVAAAGARLHAICTTLAPYGIRVAVEAFPWSPIKDVATARAIVEASGSPNAGLMIDVWHFFNTRSTLANLEGLTPEQIVAVQLNDGRIVDDDFLAEARRARLLPGEGELNIGHLLQGLYELGFRGPYCVEVNYPAFRELPVEEMATRAHATATEILKHLSSGG